MVRDNVFNSVGATSSNLAPFTKTAGLSTPFEYLSFGYHYTQQRLGLEMATPFSYVNFGHIGFQWSTFWDSPRPANSTANPHAGKGELWMGWLAWVGGAVVATLRCPRWWIRKHFLCSPREMIHFEEHIFQMGWFNHQLVTEVIFSKNSG